MSYSCGCGCGGNRCGCCEGTRAVTPREVFNRPGLTTLRRRVGEHEDFFETMRSAIARAYVDIDTGEVGPHGRGRVLRRFPLRDLGTRVTDDPTIALLDLWGVVGDILTFYTERVACEGFLRTATELLSISELARLVGYRRRPGVAASAFLAFTVDDSFKTPIVVPAGARVQSLPAPGETSVFFETGVALPARAEYNELHPRRHRPSHLPFAVAGDVVVLYLEGTATRLRANAPLLLSYGAKRDVQVLRFVESIDEDYDAARTTAQLRPPGAPSRAPQLGPEARIELDDLVRELERPPSRPPAAPARLAVSIHDTFGPGSSAVDGLIAGFHPAAADSFAAARASAALTARSELQELLALRVRASLFGHAALAPAKAHGSRGSARNLDWTYASGLADPSAMRRVIDLDTTYDDIVPGSWVVIVRPAIGPVHEPGPVTLVTRAKAVQTVSRIDYDSPGKVTRLILEDGWLPNVALKLYDLRSTVVYAAGDVLALAQEPLGNPVCGAELELDREVDGLQPGRWLVVTGERAFAGIVGRAASGVTVSEITMLAGVRQDVLRVGADGAVVSPSDPGATPVGGGGPPLGLPDDRIHTFLTLATPLAYCYERSTMKVYANVAQATHGETHSEPLGSGDPARTLQTFTLKSLPLTHVAAPTPTGVDSTLNVYVNDVRWHEAEELYDLGPADRGYATARDHTEHTSVTFGDGRLGARPAGGVENIRAAYRAGIGKAGNVRSGKLSQLVTRTDGLRGVTNPQRASGGAEPEGTESARARAPLAVSALDRLVATRDYADFALTFAGIAKATAVRLPTRGGGVVHVTVAGEDDAPIDPLADLATNLLEALRRYGDPYLPVTVAERELCALVIAARVRLDPDHLWEAVKPELQGALRDCFGLEHRKLVQDAYAAEALAALQGVVGVEYVDLDVFAAVPETTTVAELAALGSTLGAAGSVRQRIPARPARATGPAHDPAPAQLVALLSSVPTTVILTEISP